MIAFKPEARGNNQCPGMMLIVKKTTTDDTNRIGTIASRRRPIVRQIIA